VGDTGFEPVTSSVSRKCPQASDLHKREKPQVGPGRSQQLDQVQRRSAPFNTTRCSQICSHPLPTTADLAARTRSCHHSRNAKKLPAQSSRPPSIPPRSSGEVRPWPSPQTDLAPRPDVPRRPARRRLGGRKLPDLPMSAHPISLEAGELHRSFVWRSGWYWRRGHRTGGRRSRPEAVSELSYRSSPGSRL
jgi:hypothetical protein